RADCRPQTAGRRRPRYHYGLAGPENHDAGDLPHRLERCQRSDRGLACRRRRLHCEAIFISGASGPARSRHAPEAAVAGNGLAGWRPRDECDNPHRKARSHRDCPMAREFQLLEYLMRRPGQIITRAMLLESIWQYSFEPETKIIDVQVSRLRPKN